MVNLIEGLPECARPKNAVEPQQTQRSAWGPASYGGSVPRFSAEQIYSFARRAGFSPDEAATMTAIALAESGGDSRAHNPFGEDSRGLWQINARAHPELAQRFNLFDPVQNAQAAFAVSRGGADASPWTVTHGGSAARYLRHREAAQDAAVAFGDGPGLGVWTGTPGYGRPLAAGSDGAGSPAGFANPSTPAGGPAPAATGGNAALDRFIEAARGQVGDEYVFGAETDLDDADPDTFDCSELTQWAAHQAGVEIPDGATAQYLFLKQRGLLIPVEQAKNTPGALLFSFDREPRPGDGRTPGAHVAISTGDGRTIEAQNSRTDVGEFNAGDRFEFAAVLPGISDGTATPLPGGIVPPGTGAPAAPVEPAQLGGPDGDRDGLTDALERRMGLDPGRGDTDGDNLSDGYEMAVSRTGASRADTDGDQLNDAFELARGLDPASPDTDLDGHLDGSLGQSQVDTDRDGLDDALELVLGLDPRSADSDADGFIDALERQAKFDPADNAANPLRGLVDPAPGFDADPLRPLTDRADVPAADPPV
jgi:cell wall-associated NlpC family hydrolase